MSVAACGRDPMAKPAHSTGDSNSLVCARAFRVRAWLIEPAESGSRLTGTGEPTEARGFRGESESVAHSFGASPSANPVGPRKRGWHEHVDRSSGDRSHP